MHVNFKMMLEIKSSFLLFFSSNRQCNTKIRNSRKLFDEINSKKLDLIFQIPLQKKILTTLEKILKFYKHLKSIKDRPQTPHHQF